MEMLRKTEDLFFVKEIEVEGSGWLRDLIDAAGERLRQEFPALNETLIIAGPHGGRQEHFVAVLHRLDIRKVGRVGKLSFHAVYRIFRDGSGSPMK